MWISYRVCPQNAEMAALGIDKFLTSNINKSKREMSLKATSKPTVRKMDGSESTMSNVGYS